MVITDIQLRYSQGHIYVDARINGQWCQLIQEQSEETKGPISHCVSISQSTMEHFLETTPYPKSDTRV